MRSLILVAVLAASPLAAIAATDISKVNGAVRAEAGGEYGDLDTVNGSIAVGRGARADRAETVNGSIDIGDDALLGDVETVNGGVDIGSNAVVENDVETVNGGIELAPGARVGGNVETVNGKIELEAAEIGKRISTVNGDVLVGADSVVRGGILIEKPSGGWFNWGGKQRTPRVVIGRNAVVEGTLDFEREVELFVHESAKIGQVRGATAKRFSGDQP